MKHRKTLALPAIALAAAVVVSGCASTTDNGDGGDAEGPIIIGIASAQTGFFSGFDGPVKNAIELAVADVNENGGVLGRQLDVVVSDTKSDVELSATAAIEVLDKGADAIVTMCDYNLGAPAAQEALRAGKVAFSCAGSALFGPLGIGPLAFSVNESSTTQASIAATFASEQGWETAYLLGDTGEDFTKSWCEAFSQTFEDLGGTVIGQDVFVNGDTTVQPQVSALVASGVAPDVVALCGYPPTGSTAVSQLRAAGVSAPIVTTSGFDGPGWLEAVPGVSDVYAVASASIYDDDPSAAINELVEAYTAAFGEPATSYLVYGYAIVQTLVAGIEKAGSVEGADIAAALSSMGSFDTILGASEYSESCHVAIGRPMQIIEYAGGTGAWLQTIAPPADPIIPEGC